MPPTGNNQLMVMALLEAIGAMIRPPIPQVALDAILQKARDDMNQRPPGPPGPP